LPQHSRQEKEIKDIQNGKEEVRQSFFVDDIIPYIKPKDSTKKLLEIIREFRGAWVVQLVKHPTLGFSSGDDLRVMRSSPASGSTLSMEPA